jgi:hypothetical protein
MPDSSNAKVGAIETDFPESMDSIEAMVASPEHTAEFSL